MDNLVKGSETNRDRDCVIRRQANTTFHVREMGMTSRDRCAFIEKISFQNGMWKNLWDFFYTHQNARLLTGVPVCSGL